MRGKMTLAIGLALSALNLFAITNYVSLSGTNDVAGKYNTWAGAATNIQLALSVATNGNVILITNGTHALATNLTVSVSITFRSFNNGQTDPTNTIISGSGEYYANGGCFYVAAANVVFDGLTIADGRVYSGAGASGNGGGIYVGNYGGFLITNCIVTRNMSNHRGMGIYLEAGGTVKNCQIITNSVNSTNAYGYGVGIYANYIARIANCAIMSNATTVAGSLGGGLYLSGTGHTVSNCIISKNVVTQGDGGGIWFGGGTVNNCTIAGNSANNSAVAAGFGGGAYVTGASIFENTIISNNYAGVRYAADRPGGGLYINAATTLRNCLISGNGYIGIWVQATGSNVILDSCTIANNYRYNSSPAIDGPGTLNSLFVTNCVISANPGGGSNQLNNINTNNFYYSCVTDTVMQANAGNITADPLFVDTNSNFRLQMNSPAINTGINEAWMPGAVDLDGKRRLDNFSQQADVGCYEYLPVGTTFKFR
ncbi:MAG: right-handed parallel beta-helix repeat-containing protein [Lentisphaerae bacterium]|nr:right-handed parallel beta-helix repeat-containing protein [Lentisphaerota bacterium]